MKAERSLAPAEDAVILVDPQGQPLVGKNGVVTLSKLEAHQKGLLHLAVSVFIFNSLGQLMLQQRSSTKYHSAGKWSNTSCTHPVAGENPLAAARRRLAQEMGLQTPIREVFTFSYRADVGEGLIENEFDHIFIGQTEAEPQPDPLEACNWKWVAPADLDRDIQVNWVNYSVWFLMIWPAVKKIPRDISGPNFMKVPINLYSNLQRYTGGKNLVVTEGNTVGQCLIQLVQEFPQLQAVIFNDDGLVHPHVYVSVNLESVRSETLECPLKEGDRIYVILIVAGG